MTIKSVRVKFDKLMAETPRAYLLKIGHDTEYWFPKKLCRKFILNKKLGGNVVIPTWLYNEKFGEEPSLEDADLVVEHHIPEKILPIENLKPDASLTKKSNG